MRYGSKAFLAFAIAFRLAVEVCAQSPPRETAPARTTPESRSVPDAGLPVAKHDLGSLGDLKPRSKFDDFDFSFGSSDSSKSLSSFASSNRSSQAFRPTNIFGDFFGTQATPTSIVIPVKYSGIQAEFLSTQIGFDVNNNNSLDLFIGSIPNSPPNGALPTAPLIEPTQPTDAYIPASDGITKFQYAGGTATLIDSESRFDIEYFYKGEFFTAPPSASALVGRQKIAENVSPFPVNRVFVNYSYFDETPIGGGLDVRRWTPGFESLLFGENDSFEMRLPMAMTLDSNTVTNEPAMENHEVGNLYMALKHLVAKTELAALSLGLAMTVPTGDDVNVFVSSRSFGDRQVLRIANESVHLLPFVGWYVGPGRCFTQGFLQFDLDANGNSVYYNPNIQQPDLVPTGRLQDANYLYFDTQSGYWLKRLQPGDTLGKSGNGFTGFAVISELHWNRSLQPEDHIVFPSTVSLAPPRSDVQILNGLLGCVLEYNFRTHVNLGYATPIGNGADHEFKGEWRFMFNRYF
jgi:hypothetical protein